MSMLESSAPPSRHETNTVERLERWAGLCGLIGGPALAVAYLTHPPSAPPETVASAAWIWIHVGFMISLVFGVFLLTGWLGRYLRTGGRVLGVLGWASSVVSLIFVFGLDYAEVFIFPTLATEFPEVVVRYGDGTMMPSVAFAFPATGLLFLVGFVLFSYELARTKALDRLAAGFLIFGTFAFGAGLSGMLPMFVVRTGATLFGAGLVWIGVSLMRAAHQTDTSVLYRKFVT